MREDTLATVVGGRRVVRYIAAFGWFLVFNGAIGFLYRSV
jgi:hypothetical protein